MKKVIDETFLSKLDNQKSLQDLNEEHLAKHKDSAAHVQSVVRLRHALKPEDKETKTTSAKDLQDTLQSDHISLSDAEEGMRLLDEIRAGAEAKEAYLHVSREKWPEATVFVEK